MSLPFFRDFLGHPVRTRRERDAFAIGLSAIAGLAVLAADFLASLALDQSWPEMLLGLLATVPGVMLIVFIAAYSLGTARLELSRTLRRLQALEKCDPMTGLGSRAALLADYGNAADRPGVLMLISLDRFRLVNSSCGQAAGDRILIACARLIAEELGHLGRLYRTAGTEFALLGTDAHVEEARGWADALVNRIAASNFGLERRPAHLTISVGIADKPAGASFEQVYGEADQALVAARQTGRNVVQTAGAAFAANGVIEIDEIEWTGATPPAGDATARSQAPPKPPLPPAQMAC